jgi:sugar lactone lactonase YvrE
VLASDWGDHQVKLLSPNGQLLRRWSGPTDGHTGPFSQPAGLAWLPSGDVLVADMGNGRVVRITSPLAPRRLYFPLAAGPAAP